MTPESVTLVEASTPTPSDLAAVKGTQIVTTAEEIEGLHTVRAILRGLVPAKRVVMRDAVSYCAILLDDNNRKPLCRLRFNNLQKLRLGLFNEKKEEEQFALECIDDIYKYGEQLKACLAVYVPAQSKE